MRNKIQSISNRIAGAFKQKFTEHKHGIDFPIAYRPQYHEREIPKRFADKGKPMFSGKHRAVATNENFVLCFTNRCGSNWLAELLQSTGLIGLADEFFNLDRVEESLANRDLESLDALIHNRATEKEIQVEGRFITKLGWDQLFFFRKFRIIPDILPNTKYILMHRRDVAAQALSMQVALQTGQWKSYWNSGKHGKRDLSVITDEQILESIEHICMNYQQFHRYFSVFGIDPVEIYYEDLQADPEGEIKRLVNELGLAKQGEDWAIDMNKIRIQKQSDSDSKARLDAFHASMRNHKIKQVEEVEAA